LIVFVFFCNHSALGAVKLTSSKLQTDSQPLEALVGREAVRLVTKPGSLDAPAWMAVELLHGRKMVITDYSLRHYISWDTECLRNWYARSLCLLFQKNMLCTDRCDGSLLVLGQELLGFERRCNMGEPA
jgi:hypothetical protein